MFIPCYGRQSYEKPYIIIGALPSERIVYLSSVYSGVDNLHYVQAKDAAGEKYRLSPDLDYELALDVLDDIVEELNGDICPSPGESQIPLSKYYGLPHRNVSWYDVRIYHGTTPLLGLSCDYRNEKDELYKLHFEAASDKIEKYAMLFEKRLRKASDHRFKRKKPSGVLTETN